MWGGGGGAWGRGGAGCGVGVGGRTGRRRVAVGAPASGGTAPGGVGVEPPISIQIGGEERAMREGGEWGEWGAG